METKTTKERIFPIRIDNEMHKELRRASYITALPMSELIRLGAKMKLEEIKKMLLNADSIV